jgi:hypothetical protein
VSSSWKEPPLLQLHFNLICVKEEHPLPFEKWICRNGQQVRVEDRRIGVAMTLTEEQRSQV